MKVTETMASTALPVDLPDLTFIESKLLDVYWHKKELDEFLPQIATYASPMELKAITLSQLSIIENQIVQILKHLSEHDNRSLR